MLKPLNTKIDAEHYQLLERMHEQSAIPKSKLIERSLELYAKQLEEARLALELLRDVEDARQALARGETHGMDAVDAVLRKAQAKARTQAKTRPSQ